MQTLIKNRRKSVTIGETFQRRYVILTAGFVGLLTLLIFMDYFDYIRDTVLTNPVRPDLEDLLDQQALMFCLRFMLYLSSIGLFMYVLLHRVAGPVMRVRQACEALAEGDYTYRVQLRKHDDLRELEKDFNKMASVMHDDVRRSREMVETIDHQLKDLGKSAKLDHDAQKRIADIRENLPKLTDRFRI